MSDDTTRPMTPARMAEIRATDAADTWPVASSEAAHDRRALLAHLDALTPRAVDGDALGFSVFIGDMRETDNHATREAWAQMEPVSKAEYVSRAIALHAIGYAAGAVARDAEVAFLASSLDAERARRPIEEAAIAEAQRELDVTRAEIARLTRETAVQAEAWRVNEPQRTSQHHTIERLSAEREGLTQRLAGVEEQARGAVEALARAERELAAERALIVVLQGDVARLESETADFARWAHEALDRAGVAPSPADDSGVLLRVIRGLNAKDTEIARLTAELATVATERDHARRMQGHAESSEGRAARSWEAMRTELDAAQTKLAATRAAWRESEDRRAATVATLDTLAAEHAATSARERAAIRELAEARAALDAERARRPIEEAAIAEAQREIDATRAEIAEARGAVEHARMDVKMTSELQKMAEYDASVARLSGAQGADAQIADVAEIVESIRWTRANSDNPGDQAVYVDQLLALFPEQSTAEGRQG